MNGNSTWCKVHIFWEGHKIWRNLRYSCDITYLKPNYFKELSFSSSYLLGNGVLNRQVPCLKCMELACWILQASLDLYYHLKSNKKLWRRTLLLKIIWLKSKLRRIFLQIFVAFSENLNFEKICQNFLWNGEQKVLSEN